MIDNAKVKAALERLRRTDPKLGSELGRRLDRGVPEVAMLEMATARIGPALTPETIVLKTGRPVLAIARNDVEIEIREADSEVWRERLETARPLLQAPIRAIGRIELDGHPDYAWVGTGWLVRPDVIVTNRHVARTFGRRGLDGFVFSTGLGGRPIAASIDFLEEHNRPEQLSFSLREILHIEDDDGPDVAFLRIEGSDLAQPIALAQASAQELQQVAVIGYPARDSRIPDQDLMLQLFGDVYDKKRLAPGQISATGTQLQHDCSTLGGNSGSAIIDLATGQAVGIHFAGRFLLANYAVPADVIEERLHTAQTRERRVPSRPPTRDGGSAGQGSTVTSIALQAVASGGNRLECTIPLKVTVEIGNPVPALQTSSASAVAQRPAAPAVDMGGDDDEPFDTEGVPQDYVGRSGYRVEFLGGGHEVAMPEIRRDADQILSFDFNGNAQETVLRYEHYSVVMHRDRRQCFFSACNIDGNLSRKTKRGGWLIDPRIPKNRQIMKECYGNPPKFSRGHMTRREDPAWGDKNRAQRGNLDSMHVTNAVPQMQTFNGGIWLGLEDYALQNAREDDMKICVLTGPVFHANDPEMFGVVVPVVFWKVIAFIHDATGKLSATGYSISQEPFLQEFVFGAYETHQRSLRWIEQRAGLSFGALTALDRFEDTEEAAARPLRSFGQIRF